MSYIIIRIRSSLWLILITVCSTIQAEGFSVNPLYLESYPCLVKINDTEYEWGTLDSGLCIGVEGFSAFSPMNVSSLHKKILWQDSTVFPQRPFSNCLGYRGQLEQLFKAGQSDCLCSGTKQNGFFELGVERKLPGGHFVCKTRGQAYHNYMIAEPNVFEIADSSVQDLPRSLGYLKAGFGIFTVLFSVSFLCEKRFGLTLVDITAILTHTLVFYLRFREFPKMG